MSPADAFSAKFTHVLTKEHRLTFLGINALVLTPLLCHTMILEYLSTGSINTFVLDAMRIILDIFLSYIS